MDVRTLLVVAGGGAGGALCRYLSVLLARGVLGDGPGPVALVNVLGCFGFGATWALCEQRGSPLIGALLLAGFFGGFTTFSAFAFDAYALLLERRYGAFCLDLLLQNGLGIAALLAGIWLVAAMRG